MIIYTTSILFLLCVSVASFCPKPEENGCCHGQYRRGDECIDCEPGTFGVACLEKCPDGKCGQFCGQLCDCDQRSQVCDIAKCCVNVTNIKCQTTLTSQDSESASTSQTHQSTETENWPPSSLPDETFTGTHGRLKFFKMDKFCLILVSVAMFVIILLLITAAYLYRNIKRLKTTLRDTNMQLIKCQMESDINNLKASQQTAVTKEEAPYMECGEVHVSSVPALQDTSGYLLMEAVPIGARYVEMNKRWQSTENMIN